MAITNSHNSQSLIFKRNLKTIKFILPWTSGIKSTLILNADWLRRENSCWTFNNVTNTFLAISSQNGNYIEKNAHAHSEFRRVNGRKKEEKIQNT